MAPTPGTSFSSISLHKFILLFDASILTASPFPTLPHVALHPDNSKSLLFCLFSASSVHLFPNCAVSLLLTHSATQFARPLFPQPCTLLSFFSEALHSPSHFCSFQRRPSGPKLAQEQARRKSVRGTLWGSAPPPGFPVRGGGTGCLRDTGAAVPPGTSQR